MAGTGPAPKDPAQRRNRHEPKRGEWTNLPPLEHPVLPDLPLGEWSERTNTAWDAWRQDRATTQYGPAEIQVAIDLAYIYEEWVREPSASLAGEIRQRQDSLGLTPKGKQDRRWRVIDPEEEGTTPKPKPRPKRRNGNAKRGGLSVVPDPE